MLNVGDFGSSFNLFLIFASSINSALSKVDKTVHQAFCGPLVRLLWKWSRWEPFFIMMNEDEWIQEIDLFILQVEVLVVPAGEEETVDAVIPGLQCPWCGGPIIMTLEDNYLWIKDAGEGVDMSDIFLRLVIQRIRQKHPEWQLRSSCKKCNEELTFLEEHVCGGNPK